MPEKTYRRIEETLKRINEHPEYSSKVHSETVHQLLCEAARHSMSIELVAETEAGYEAHIPRPVILDRLRQGWDELTKYGANLGTFTVLGKMIAPEKNPHPTFRTKDVTFGGIEGTTATLIMYEVQNLSLYLADNSINPITRAIEAHLQLVRIHPYTDGNGRIARLTQNYVLHHNNYPPAIIQESDRELYVTLLNNTLIDRINENSFSWEPSQHELTFREYIASKTLQSAKKIEEQLSKRRRYIVELPTVTDPAHAISIANRLRDNASRVGNGISVRKQRISGGKRKRKKSYYNLEVVGDVSQEHIKASMEKRDTRYKIKKKE